MTPDARPSSIAVWILLALALLCRLIALDHQSLWWDEAWQRLMASEPSFPAVAERLWREPLAAHPPLSHWIHHAFLSIDDSDFMLRLPGVIFGTLSVIFVLGLGRRLFSEATARWAALLWAVSPLQIWFSQDARMYSALMFFSAASTWLWLRALDRGRVRDWAWLGIVSTLGMYTHLFFVLIAAVQGVWTWAFHRKSLKAACVTWALVGLAFTPMLPFFWSRRALIAGSELNLLAPIYGFFTYAAGFSLGPSVLELKANPGFATLRPELIWIGLTGLTFGTAMLAGLFACVRGDRARWLVPIALVSPFVMVTLASLSSSFVFNVRYTVVAFPFFCLLVGAGLSALARWKPLQSIWVLLVFGISIVSVVQLATNPRYAKEDVRAAVAVWQRLEVRDLIASHAANVTVDRYLNSAEREDHIPLGGSAEQESQQLLEIWQRRGARRTLHLVVARDPWRSVPEAMREVFEVSEVEQFPGGVTLYELRQRDDPDR